MSIIRRVYHSTISALSTCDSELTWRHSRLDGIFNIFEKKNFCEKRNDGPKRL